MMKFLLLRGISLRFARDVRAERRVQAGHVVESVIVRPASLDGDVSANPVALNLSMVIPRSETLQRFP